MYQEMDEKTIFVRLPLNMHGQITIPKSVREEMKLIPGESQVDVRLSGENLSVSRTKTLDEVEEELEAIREELPEETKEKIRKEGGKTVRELREDWEKSEAGKNYYKKYSLEEG